MKVKLLFFALFAIAVSACTKEEDVLSFDGDVKVLKERDPNSPLILFQKQYVTPDLTTRATKVTFDDYLGRSFRATAYPYADEENLRFAVVDIKKLEAAHKDYFNVHRIGHSVVNAFSFASFDRYQEKSQVVKKVNSGFSINVGLFKIGHKRKMTEIFGSTITDNTQNIFGELNIAIDQNFYEMQYSSNISEIIMKDYLTATFKDELYNTPIEEFYKNYGAFVLTGFVTGGRATAFYSGIYKQEATATVKEKALDNEINASFSLKNVGASADLSFGKNSSGSGSSTESGVTEISMAIETVGGSPAYPIFTVPQKLEDVNLNLSQWMASLADTATHSIVDIADGGLVPISAFIMEKNVKNRLGLCMKGDAMQHLLKEPQIIFERILSASSSTTTNCNVYLYTRNHEFITLDHVSVPNIDFWIEKESERYSRIYGLTIKVNKRIGKSFIESIKKFNYDAPLMERSFCYKSADGAVYLLDPVQKVGYSLHNDYLLDTYAIRSFVKLLPTHDLTFEELRKYILIAL